MNHYQQIVLASRPTGAPVAENFRLESRPMPVPGDGELLVRARYLSLDPYMRGRMSDAKSYAKPVEIGEPMEGETVAEVVESRHPEYRPGDLVQARIGWRTHAAISITGVRRVDPGLAPITTALGVLGMPGFAAYAGMKVIGQPKPGETVVVAAASGPVGSLVGQLAKLAGARAVGIAGGPEKCAYVRDQLGFDAAIDHRSAGLAEKLAVSASTSILKTLAARSGRRFCRCSIASRGCRCVASSPITTAPPAPSRIFYRLRCWRSCVAACCYAATSTPNSSTSTTTPSCGRSAREYAPAISSIAKTSSTPSRTRRRPSSVCCPAGTLVKRSFAFRDACAGLRRRRFRREARVTSWR
jgi:N-terminal domain of oxidoreductase